MKNLTNRLDIKHELERKHGHGALSRFARKHDYSLPYVSQTISGDRSNETILKRLADYAGCRVYGVFPSKDVNRKS